MLSILVIAICLVFVAFFTATETALTSLSSLKTRHLRERQGLGAKILDMWIEKPTRVLTALLLGNTLATIVATAVVVENVLQDQFASHLVAAGILGLTAFIVVFCAVISRALAKTYASDLAIVTLSLFRPFYWLFAPVTHALSFVSRFVSEATSRKTKAPAPQITEEELEFLINVGEEEGVLADEKHEMLSGIFELSETVVREIMVHRGDIRALSAKSSLRACLELSRATGLSRLPVHEGELDHVVGVVHVKDILTAALVPSADLEQTLSAFLEQHARPAVFVPESKAVDQLFQDMRKQRQHLAIVLDEYGSVSGLVTMEDIIEEIVGEVRDEFDDEEDAIRPGQVENQYLVECKIHIDDF